MAKKSRPARETPAPAAPSAPASPARFPWGWLALALALTAFVFLPSLDFSFVYDDREQILQNTRLRLADYPAKALFEDLWRFRTPDPDAGRPGGQYYRPAFALWLWGNWQAFGESPRGWHATTLALHLAVTWLLALFVRRLGGGRGAVLGAALLFGLHPIHAESVAWVTGSNDLLLALFTLGALLAAFRPPGHERLPAWRYPLSLLLFALAALTKETAYTFPVLFAALRWYEDGSPNNSPATASQPAAEEPPGGRFRRLVVAPILFSLPWGAVAFAVFFARLRVIGYLGKPLSEKPLSGAEALLTIPRVVAEYVAMTLTSFPAGLGHPIRPPAGIASPGFWLPLAVVGLLVAWILLSGGWRRPEAPLLAAGVVLPLVAVLNLRLLIPDALVQDRYLYLATAFAIPAVVLPLERRLPMRLFAAVIGVLALLAAVRLPILRDTFRDDSPSSPVRRRTPRTTASSTTGSASPSSKQERPTRRSATCRAPSSSSRTTG